MDAEQLADIALHAGRLAARVHRRHAGELAVEEWAEKGASDFVTRVDTEAERVIISAIRECCPGHEFMAEESARLGDPDSVRAAFDGAEYLWVIDPLDGTTNFLHGFPSYAASVAVAHRGEIIAGAVVEGHGDSAWWAWKGGGAWRDGARVTVSTLDRLELALVGTGFPFKVTDLLPGYLRQFDAILRRTSGIRRAGAAAIDLCHVAEGRLDGFWELWLAPWDIAAGVLMVREAGGTVTSLDGANDVRAAGPIIAGNPAIHARLRSVLAEVEQPEPSPK
jgi:myo-inositol-1(or 4)-monophosphatase